MKNRKVSLAFPCSLTATFRSAPPYHHPHFGGVVNPRAWRHGNGLLQPQITAVIPTLLIVSGYTSRQSELFVQSRFEMLLAKLSFGVQTRNWIRCWDLTYFMHSSCIVGAAHRCSVQVECIRPIFRLTFLLHHSCLQEVSSRGSNNLCNSSPSSLHFSKVIDDYEHSQLAPSPLSTYSNVQLCCPRCLLCTVNFHPLG